MPVEIKSDAGTAPPAGEMKTSTGEKAEGLRDISPQQ